MLKSQTTRKAGPEIDALWLGAGRTEADLQKPQILIESTFGDSHPGSRHLMGLAESARNALYAAQAMPAIYTVTDICDGVATGHQGMDYSLVSRDLIAAMVEVHAMAAGFDGLVTISSCDKATPGHLMALARLDLPGLHVCGGSMMPGPAFISADSCYETNLRVAEGNMSPQEEWYYKKNACPSCGACQYMGTASTMQAMAEALGMAIPSNAMMPANTNYIAQTAAEAGRLAAELVRRDLRPSQIMTRAAFENAIKIHAAIGGSANAVLHLPAIARELGISLDLEDFERLSEGIPLLTSILTAGKWPTQFFWYAGGVPRIMLELRDVLNLDLPTVTGRTIRENLTALEDAGYFRRSAEFLGNYNLRVEDIIRHPDQPISEDSGLAVLWGNLAPEGSVIKAYAVDPRMRHFIGKARIFDTEEAAVDAIYRDQIMPGDAVVIRYKGERAAGMPEMLKATDAICNKPALHCSTALITDGRFSGASRGPCIGYLKPEAASGGPIALLRDGDMIEINVDERSLNFIGANGITLGAEECRKILEERRKHQEIKHFSHRGALRYLCG